MVPPELPSTAGEPAAPLAAPPRRRRRWWWLLLPALLLLAWGGYRLAHPRSLRPVGGMPEKGALLAVTSYGMLEISREDRGYIARDWQGREHWRVPIEGAKGVERLREHSSNYQHIAQLTIEPHAARVRVWQTGRDSGEAIVAVSALASASRLSPMRYSLAALDDGGAMLAVQTAKTTTRLFRIDGRRVSAQGEYTVRQHPGSGVLYPQLSPDGNLLVLTDNGNLNTECIRLTVQQGRITCTPLYTATLVDNWRFMADDILLDEDGTRYYPGGRVSKAPSGWTNVRIAISEQLRRGAILQTTYDGSTPWEERHRVLDARTGATWEVPQRGYVNAWSLSTDGRVAALLEDAPPLPGYMEKAVEMLPFLAEPLARSRDWTQICIYERPGRLRARLVVKDNMVRDINLSPDGRRLVVDRMTDEETTRYDVYVW